MEPDKEDKKADWKFITFLVLFVLALGSAIINPYAGVTFFLFLLFIGYYFSGE